MKGICFIPPLYDATIEGVKDETRRIIPNCDSLRQSVFVKSNYETLHGRELKPKYKEGEIIYLKEPYKLEEYSAGLYQIFYKFGGEPMLIDISEWKISKNQIDKIIKQQNKSKSGYANKLFMPAWCARRFIKITNYRAEALQDITDIGCVREGIKKIEGEVIGYPVGVSFNYSNGFANWTTYREAYADLIDRINGKGTWNSNPFVWVYDYELTEKPKAK